MTHASRMATGVEPAPQGAEPVALVENPEGRSPILSSASTRPTIFRPVTAPWAWVPGSWRATSPGIREPSGLQGPCPAFSMRR
jgi:hypothetical protein